jgi:predicted Zn-dependent protease
LQLTRLLAEAEKKPWDAAVRRQIAELCLQLRRPAEAQMWARAALVCDPADPAAGRLLARAEGAAGGLVEHPYLTTQRGLSP